MLANRKNLVVHRYVDIFNLDTTHSPSRSLNRVVKETISLLFNDRNMFDFAAGSLSFFFCLRWRSAIIMEKDA